MAGDVVSLMRHLGHEQFAMVGHDLGSLPAFRTAMDHPRAVTRLLVMDGLPIVEDLERLNEVFVRTWWHWWFYGRTEKPTERVINSTLPPGTGLPHRKRWERAIRQRLGGFTRSRRRARHVRGLPGRPVHRSRAQSAAPAVRARVPVLR